MMRLGLSSLQKVLVITTAEKMMSNDAMTSKRVVSNIKKYNIR